MILNQTPEIVRVLVRVSFEKVQNSNILYKYSIFFDKYWPVMLNWNWTYVTFKTKEH